MLFSFTVTGALSGSYNPTLTAIALTANSAWIGRTGCFLVSVSESKQELLDVLLCLLYYPTLFDFGFFSRFLKSHSTSSTIAFLMRSQASPART